MNTERRTGEEPVPRNPERHLNTTQLSVLHQVEGFGWKLKFLRRPLFQDSVAVITNADGSQTGVLEEDGEINMNSEIPFRE